MSSNDKEKTMPSDAINHQPTGLAAKHKVGPVIMSRYIKNIKAAYWVFRDLTAARCQALFSTSISMALLTTMDKYMRDFLIRLDKSSRVWVSNSRRAFFTLCGFNGY